MTIRSKALISFFAGALFTTLYAEPGRTAGTDRGKSEADEKARRPSDAEIIAVAKTANDGEIAQGKLAEKRATKRATKSVAEMMVADHSNANRRLENLAKELGITPKQSAESADVKNDGNAVERTLNQSSADSFDRVYLQAQVDEHEKVLKALDERLIPSASAAKLKELLTDIRAHVAHHLQVAKQTLENLDKSS